MNAFFQTSSPDLPFLFIPTSHLYYVTYTVVIFIQPRLQSVKRVTFHYILQLFVPDIIAHVFLISAMIRS